MTIVVTRTGKGTDLDIADNDGNLSSLSGINEAQTGTSYTVVAADQNRTIELSNASSVSVTLSTIATIRAGIDTDDFKVTLKNVGAGVVSITRGGSDTFDDGGTALALRTGQYVTIQTDSTNAIWNIIGGNYSGMDFVGDLTGDVNAADGTQVLDSGTDGSDATFTGDVTGDLTGNADTVTTNANLTGDVTSVGNTTTIPADSIDDSKLVSPAADSTYAVHRIRGANEPVTVTNTAYPGAGYWQDAAGAVRIGTALISGVIRVNYVYSIDTGGVNYIVAGVYKNDAGQPGQTSTNNTSPTAASIDVTVTAGDIVSLQFYVPSLSTGTVHTIYVTSDSQNMAIA
jgi:hypothetical protein